MRVLHVAAMPFPSPQGTQAATHAMLAALAAAGHETHLATYARGRGAVDARVVVHRVPDVPRDASLRSGPSLRKLALDASLAWTVARVVREVRPELVVAHHVEAMLAALGSGAGRARPLVFVAHTGLGPELPAYVASPLAPVARVFGGAVDAALVRRADVALAVAPTLADALSQRARRAVTFVPIPWPPPSSPPETVPRADARRALGLADDDEVLLYAGNLDAYQGIDVLLRAAALVRARRPRARLCIATESDASALPHDVVRAPLATERDRARAHAAADVALVPRALPGGAPVKLLDALARGVPVVAARRATGGLLLDAAAAVALDDDADALATAAATLLAAPSAREALAAAGRAYVARVHAPARFVEAFEAATAVRAR